MAVSLEERVAGHSDFFDRLVELIPARYYVPDEANPEWSKFQRRRRQGGHEAGEGELQEALGPSSSPETR